MNTFFYLALGLILIAFAYAVRQDLKVRQELRSAICDGVRARGCVTKGFVYEMGGLPGPGEKMPESPGDTTCGPIVQVELPQGGAVKSSSNVFEDDWIKCSEVYARVRDLGMTDLDEFMRVEPQWFLSPKDRLLARDAVDLYAKEVA